MKICTYCLSAPIPEAERRKTKSLLCTDPTKQA